MDIWGDTPALESLRTDTRQTAPQGTVFSQCLLQEPRCVDGETEAQAVRAKACGQEVQS